MKPLLFLAFLGLAPAIGEQIAPVGDRVIGMGTPLATPVHAVVGDVEQLPDRDPLAESGAGALRGHDAVARAGRTEVVR